ncbi:MAG: hypothetical protein WBD40_20920 [Tepidisphaeraceae bacterium]
MTQSISCLLVYIASFGLMGGCGDQHRAAPAERMPNTMTAAARQPARPVDHAVLDFVLGDLLTLNDSPLKVRNGPPAEIRFAPEPARYPVTPKRVLMRRDEKLWAALSQTDVDGAAEATAALILRHERKETFGPFQPATPRVKLETQPPPTTIGSIYERPVRAWPPGYSDDGRYAVVFLSIPWSMHHADGTYLLRREADGWRVALRQFVYYF